MSLKEGNFIIQVFKNKPSQQRQGPTWSPHWLTPARRRVSTESEPLTTSTALKPTGNSRRQLSGEYLSIAGISSFQLPASKRIMRNYIARANSVQEGRRSWGAGQLMKPKPKLKAETKPNTVASGGGLEEGRQSPEEKAKKAVCVVRCVSWSSWAAGIW